MPLFLMYLENRIVVVVCGFYKFLLAFSTSMTYNIIKKKEVSIVEFNNMYEDIYGNAAYLTSEELDWFYGIVEKFKILDETKGIEILNRNHEELCGKSKEALGEFYTDDPKDANADCFITIDNYFIHEQFEWIFNGKHNLTFDTLENVISHEIAHRFQFRHCKRHAKLTAEILQKYNEMIGEVA